MKTERQRKRNAFMFMIFAALFLFLGTFLVLNSLRIRQDMIPVEGRIASIDVASNDRTTVMIEYIFNGTTYSFRSSTFSSTMRVGDASTVYIDPNNPSVYHQSDLFLFILVPGILAVVFGGIGIFTYLPFIKAKKRHRTLMQNGSKRRAIITSLSTNQSVTMNKMYKSHLTCKIVDAYTEEETIYKSKSFWAPKDFRVETGVSTVDVWIDPNDKFNYHVDTSSLFNKSM